MVKAGGFISSRDTLVSEAVVIQFPAVEMVAQLPAVEMVALAPVVEVVALAPSCRSGCLAPEDNDEGEYEH